MKKSVPLFAVLSAFVLFGVNGGANAQPLVNKDVLVVVESHGLQVTSHDLSAELMKAPENVRNSLLFRKEGLGQLAVNLLMRRVLAKQAEVNRVLDDPINRAAVELAKEKVLSDIQLARVDGMNRPPKDILEQRARDLYKAEPKRFENPEQVRVSHLLVAKGEGAKEKAELLLSELKGGKDFAELAKEKSEDPGSAAKGGDLGTFGRGRMVKPFEDAAFSLKTGELSEVVETQFGFHILKVTEHTMASVKPFEDVKAVIEDEILKKVQADGRIRLGQQLMSNVQPSMEALDAFISSQKPKE